LKVVTSKVYMLLFWEIVRFQLAINMRAHCEYKEITMAMFEQAGFVRLEDFIAVAKTGVKLHASVALERQFVTQKEPHRKTERTENELDMYLLCAIFTFKMGSGNKTVSKVYLCGSIGESSHDSRVHMNIANARLTADYKRLRDANITIDEKFFNML